MQASSLYTASIEANGNSSSIIPAPPAAAVAGIVPSSEGVLQASSSTPSRPGSAGTGAGTGGGTPGSYLASTEVLNRALTGKCQELAAEQKLRRDAEARAAALSAQVAQLQAQMAELMQQREADRAEVAALKQQLGSGR